MPEPAAKEPTPNYITPSGLQRLRDELRFLLTRERPAVTQVVAWAAGNGDRSENADYQYGKRRLRQIDRRIRFLTKRIDAAEVVDPEAPESGRAATQRLFRSDRALRQRRWNGAGGEHRRRRRGRSGSSPHQLDVAAGARVDEVRTRRPRGPSRARRLRSNCRFSRCVTSASPWRRSASHPALRLRPRLRLEPSASSGPDCGRSPFGVVFFAPTWARRLVPTGVIFSKLSHPRRSPRQPSRADSVPSGLAVCGPKPVPSSAGSRRRRFPLESSISRDMAPYAIATPTRRRRSAPPSPPATTPEADGCWCLPDAS